MHRKKCGDGKGRSFTRCVNKGSGRQRHIWRNSKRGCMNNDQQDGR
jgi:hypothetical protein